MAQNISTPKDGCFEVKRQAVSGSIGIPFGVAIPSCTSWCWSKSYPFISSSIMCIYIYINIYIYIGLYQIIVPFQKTELDYCFALHKHGSWTQKGNVLDTFWVIDVYQLV
jgi:hypothetical protein